MHTEFSWILSCLSREPAASSCFPRRNGSGKRCEKTEGAKIHGQARYIANFLRKRESNRWIFISIHGAIYHSKSLAVDDGGGGCVCFFRTQPRNPRATHTGNRAPLVTCHEFRPRKHGGSFSSAGQNVFCTFVTARVTFARPSTLYRHLHVVPFSRWIRPYRAKPSHATETWSFRRSRSAIYFPRVSEQIGCIKRSPNRKSETQTPYPIVRELKQRVCQRIAIPCVRPRLALNIRGCRQMDIR